MKNRVSELEKRPIGGTGGTADHAALSNLGYAAAAHTGFSQDTHTHADYYLKTTTSAYAQSTHTHGGYYVKTTDDLGDNYARSTHVHGGYYLATNVSHAADHFTGGTSDLSNYYAKTSAVSGGTVNWAEATTLLNKTIDWNSNTMANGMELVGYGTSGTGTFSFSNLETNFDVVGSIEHYKVRYVIASDTGVGDSFNMRINNDNKSAQYSWKRYLITTDAVDSLTNTADTKINLGDTSAAQGTQSGTIDIFYEKSATKKVFNVGMHDAEPNPDNVAGIYFNTTNRISSIDFSLASGNFASPSKFWLYRTVRQ